jgi:hypothetical protein
MTETAPIDSIDPLRTPASPSGVSAAAIQPARQL